MQLGYDVDQLEVLLDDAAILGVELEPRFRVLAVTFEPLDAHVARILGAAPAAPDRRMQLACFPVSTILGSLRQTQDNGLVSVLKFSEAQLVDVVAAFDGASTHSPIFRQPEPRPNSLAPSWSLEGRSTAPDGVSLTLTLRLRNADLALDLFARFDEVRLSDATGTPVTTGT